MWAVTGATRILEVISQSRNDQMMSVIRWTSGVVVAAWVAYLAAALAGHQLLAGSPARPVVQSTLAVLVIVLVVAVIVERVARRVEACAGGRYRDGYAEGYVDGRANREPSPDRTLRLVRSCHQGGHQGGHQDR